MQLMKEERDLVSEKDYKEFLSKNEKILSRNFEKNAYLALLMQEMEEKETQPQPRKWTHKEEESLKTLAKQNTPIEEIERIFHKHKREELRKKYESVLGIISKEN